MNQSSKFINPVFAIYVDFDTVNNFLSNHFLILIILFENRTMYSVSGTMFTLILLYQKEFEDCGSS